jgi:cysteine-rich repeat protein
VPQHRLAPRLAFVSALLALAGLAACGGPGGADDAGPSLDVGMDAGPADAGEPDAGSDAGPPDTGPVCGDGELEGTEACDDGNRRADDGCSADCRIECGDGRVSGEELCDVGIASGEGSCPTACDDGEACTTDTLLGTACAASCAATAITVARDEDGCCPPDATSLVDRDCPVVCGNGLLELGELCDAAIVAGAGACPESCDDGAACTSDVLVGPGTCSAACVSTEITAPAAGDGCCPAGATVATDADCSPFCGDGVLTAGEVCDVGIASGAGSCPASCDDAEVCTRDALTGGGSCAATCTHTPLGPAAGDGCCPSGATIGTDADCPARCGDGVRTAPEACDDGNVLTGDGCSPTCGREPLAFRFTTLQFQDPRLFNGALDVTPEVNGYIRMALTLDDGPPDGFIDLSLVVRFDPLDQSAASTPGSIGFARCSMPLSSTSCTAVAGGSQAITAVNRTSGTCLAPLPGTTPPERLVNTPTAPCFSLALPETLDIRVSTVVVRLRDVELGAQYLGDPARGLVTGLLRGFLTESDAMSTRFGERDLTAVLRESDRDVLDGEPGWWLYMAFTGDPVPYTP